MGFIAGDMTTAQYILVLLALCTIVKEASFVPTKPDIILKLDQFGSCPEYPDIISGYKDVTMKMVGRYEVALNATYFINEPISEEYKMTAELSKCLSKQQEDSCEPFLMYDFNMCEHMHEEGKPWSNLINATQNFSPICPLKPGTYKLENSIMDCENYDELMTDGYWKLFAVGKIGDKVVFCMRCALTVTIKKRRSELL